MIPSVRSPDLAVSFLRHGYTFIGAHCDRLGTDAFFGRLLGRRTLFLRGPDAVELLYASGRFPRTGALPGSAVKLLQDQGSVQQLEGAAHRLRKDLFVRLGSPAEADRLAGIFERHAIAALPRWHRAATVALHDELVLLLGLSAQEWAGIPPHRRSERRARELGLMVEHAGSVGPANWMARLRRRGTESWARSLVRAARHGHDDGTPLAMVAHHRDGEGRLLDEPIAAIELLNLLRPVVAVSRFIAFAAVALDAEPAWQELFRLGDTAELTHFAQEVRRTAPFFPAVAGIADRDFTWDGTTVPAGTRTVADLYGTNNDPRVWPAPRHFDPARFRAVEVAPGHLVPQGGGDVHEGHRCPGEDLTLRLMERAIVVLSGSRFRLPPQDLSVSLHRMPALPASGVLAAFPTPVPGPAATALDGQRVGPDFTPPSEPDSGEDPVPNH